MLISILRNDGKGGFLSAVNLQAGTEPLFVVLDDFDGSGTLDAVVATDAANGESLFTHAKLCDAP